MLVIFIFLQIGSHCVAQFGCMYILCVYLYIITISQKVQYKHCIYELGTLTKQKVAK